MFDIIGRVAVDFKRVSVLFKPLAKPLPVCPMYAFLETGHRLTYRWLLSKDCELRYLCP